MTAADASAVRTKNNRLNLCKLLVFISSFFSFLLFLFFYILLLIVSSLVGDWWLVIGFVWSHLCFVVRGWWSVVGFFTVIASLPAVTGFIVIASLLAKPRCRSNLTRAFTKSTYSVRAARY